MLSRRILQNKHFKSKLSLSLKDIKFSKQKFSNGNLILNIKYYHLRSYNNKLSYLFIY